MNAIPRTGSRQILLECHPALLLAGGHPEPGFYTPEFLFIQEIHHRAETITPLLKEMLEFRPAPDWKQEMKDGAPAPN